MPRVARIVAPDLPHHVTQRGNYRQNVFDDDSDRRRYLLWINEYSHKYNLSIIAYCLMSNHVHFIVIPKNEDSVARTFNSAHMRYSQYRNKNMNVTGHLWQGRFFSCILDERRLTAAARYIERNPARARIVKNPCEYIWSSAKNHAGISKNDIIDTSGLFKCIEIAQKEWKDFISREDRPDEVAAIRKYTLTGRPLGGSAFIKKLEKALSMRLQAMPVGRPKKGSNDKEEIGRCP